MMLYVNNGMKIYTIIVYTIIRKMNASLIVALIIVILNT